MRGSAIAISAALALLAASPGARAQPKAEDESSTLVVEGRADLRRGALDDAARALDQAIALNPRRVDAYVLRAAVHVAKKEYAAGIALARQARALDPQNDDVLAMLGTLLVLDGQLDEGVPMLEGVVARGPGRYEAHALLADHDARVSDWPRAIAEFEAYLRTRPRELARQDDVYRVELADAYLRDGQARRAEALFGEVVRSRPRDLRARLGQAWAAAATDCRRARPMLAALRDEAAGRPEIAIVDARCAIATGALDEAAAIARRLVAELPDGADAHALVADVLVAQGDVAGARGELAHARELEPGSRRWAVKAAEAARRGGAAAEAIAILDALGPPAAPVRDRAWWRELALSLGAAGQPDAVVERVAPVAAALGDAAAFAALGDAELARGHAADAVGWLEQAEHAGGGARARTSLARALEASGVAKIAAGDLDGAETELARAAGLAGAGTPGAPTVWRNLGVARLAAGHATDAVVALAQATRVAPDALTWMLYARAQAAAAASAKARDAYARAQALAQGGDAITVALDAAGFDLDAGDPAAAVAALERVKAPDARVKAALETARHAAALAALRAGQGGRAIALLEQATKDAPAAGAAEARAVACDLALATVVGGDRDVAAHRLRALGGAPCPFPAPADVQAVPILTALVDGLRVHGAADALARLARLARTATGPARALVATATRVVALAAADDAYRAGQLAAAETYVAAAHAADAHGDADEVALDQAVVDVAAGRLDVAIAALEKLAPRLPDALVSLGVAYDKHGQQPQALDAWRRARKASAKWAPLGDWIDALERIYGPEAAP